MKTLSTMQLSAYLKRLTIAFFGILISAAAIAQEKAADLPATAAVTTPEKTGLFYNPVFVGLLSIAVFLMLVILIFSRVAIGAISFRMEEDRKKRASENLPKILLVMLSLSAFTPAFGQTDTTAAAAPLSGTAAASSGYWGMDGTTFWGLVCMIAFEAAIAWKLYTIAMERLGTYERKARQAEARRTAKAAVVRPTLIEKLNRSVAIEKEADIMLDHNYDGIRELDNNLPPWWKYGFYVSIIFSVVYLFHYHVFHTGKLQIDEYNEQLAQAERDMAEYRKKAANLVDENNATLLTDESALSSGRSTFTTNCAACHGDNGEGGVGPNLTDDYWLHGGDIKDVFKTIKLGYPEKGMKSWQQDLGARQIHEVASYVKSLRGTKPANPKEPEGELFRETADTTKSE
jgi:cytochrome c oxidase cbb3-type subunit III